MAKDNNLQDFLTDIADAIREKKGTTEKINPQNFSSEIKGITSGGGSGEGSSSQPNGYYWKFKFVDLRGNYVDMSQLSEQELGAIQMLYQIQRTMPLIHSAFFCSSSIDPTYTHNRYEVYFSMGGMPFFLDKLMNESADEIIGMDSLFNSSMLCAWSECNVIIPEAEEAFGKSEFNLIDTVKILLLPAMDMEVTDENVMMVISEMLMLEAVTKEEYESYIY